MAYDDKSALILTTIVVDTTTGVASLKSFEKQTEATAQNVKGSLGKMDDGLGPLRDMLAKSKGDALAFEGTIRNLGDTGARAGSALSTGMGSAAIGIGLVAAAAGGAYFALDRFADAADRVTDLHRGFDALTRAAGETGESFLAKMRPATEGLVSDTELMLATNRALLLELPVTAQSMADLAGEAVRLGKAQGIDAAQSVDLLTDGIGRQSSRMLKQIGITIDAKEAYRDYADELGKTAGDLTDAERVQAFYNAAATEAKAKADVLIDTLPTFSDQWKKAGNEIANTKDNLLAFVNLHMGPQIVQVEQEAAALERMSAAIDAGGKKLELYNEAGQKFSTTNLVAGGMEQFSEGAAKTATLTKALDTAHTKLDDDRAAVATLNRLLGETNDVDMRKLIQVSLKGVTDEMNRLLGVGKETKLTLDQIADRDFRAGKHLPGAQPDEPTRIPTSPAPGELELIENLDRRLLSAIGDAQQLNTALDALSKAREDSALQTIEPGARAAFSMGPSLQQEIAVAEQRKEISLRALDEQLDLEKQRLDLAHQKELIDDATDLDAREAARAKYETDVTALTLKGETERRKITNATTQVEVAAINTRLLSNLRATQDAVGALQSAFTAHKAFALALGQINVALAITEVWADPSTSNYYVKIAQSVALAAAGAAQIAAMRSATPGSGTVVSPGGGGGAGASTSPSYANAITTPTSGQFTGTTPVVTGTPPPVQTAPPAVQRPIILPTQPEVMAAPPAAVTTTPIIVQTPASDIQPMLDQMSNLIETARKGNAIQAEVATNTARVGLLFDQMRSQIGASSTVGYPPPEDAPPFDSPTPSRPPIVWNPPQHIVPPHSGVNPRAGRDEPPSAQPVTQITVHFNVSAMDASSFNEFIQKGNTLRDLKQLLDRYTARY